MQPNGAARFATAGRLVAGLLAGLTALAGGACHTTVDSLGYDDATGIKFHHFTGPSTYPNAFQDVLSKSNEEIAAKLAGAYQQLFHGAPDSEAIYFEGPTDTQASIKDVLHNDVRTEGLGLGMLIAFELDKQDEFDRLWTYAKEQLKVTTGAASGYFESSCSNMPGAELPCFDPYGMQYMLMALLLANNRPPPWGTQEGFVDYNKEAQDLLTVMRHKQDENGGIVDGMTDVFDSSSRLVFDQPKASAAGATRPSLEMPAFYDLWAQATGDPFWTRAATAGRNLWKAAANFDTVTDTGTGLVPTRSRFDGSPDPDAGTFGPDAYRTYINIVLDRIWTPTDDWDVREATKVLQFFVSKGITTYGHSYQLNGDVIDSTREASLVVINGITALVADPTFAPRRAFIQEIWDFDIPSGANRYYSGILYMLSLLILSGECQVH